MINFSNHMKIENNFKKIFLVE